MGRWERRLKAIIEPKADASDVNEKIVSIAG
jgi:hypothetical protein